MHQRHTMRCGCNRRCVDARSTASRGAGSGAEVAAAQRAARAAGDGLDTDGVGTEGGAVGTHRALIAGEPGRQRVNADRGPLGALVAAAIVGAAAEALAAAGAAVEARRAASRGRQAVAADAFLILAAARAAGPAMVGIAIQIGAITIATAFVGAAAVVALAAVILIRIGVDTLAITFAKPGPTPALVPRALGVGATIAGALAFAADLFAGGRRDGSGEVRGRRGQANDEGGDEPAPGESGDNRAGQLIDVLLCQRNRSFVNEGSAQASGRARSRLTGRRQEHGPNATPHVLLVPRGS